MSSRAKARIGLRRAYAAPARGDGARVLVDRVWPRGVRKDELQLAAWLKEAAPSTELRKWFGHDPARWTAFRERYFAELDTRPEPVARLLDFCRKGRVTLVFGARDEAHNNAVALRDYLVRALNR